MKNANLKEMLSKAEQRAVKDAASKVHHMQFVVELQDQVKTEKEAALTKHSEIAYLKEQIQKVQEKTALWAKRKQEWDIKEQRRVQADSNQTSNNLVTKLVLWIMAFCMIVGEAALIAPTLDSIGISNAITQYFVAFTIIVAFISFLEISFSRSLEAIRLPNKLGWGLPLLFITSVMVVFGIVRSFGLEEAAKITGGPSWDIIQNHAIVFRVFWVFITITMPWAAVLALFKASKCSMIENYIQPFPEENNGEIELKKLQGKLDSFQIKLNLEYEELLEVVKNRYVDRYFEERSRK